MLILDRLLLTAVLALAAWRLFAPGWRADWRIIAALVAALLAVVQLAVCGFTWQDLPAYGLLVVTATPPLRTGRILRWAGRLSQAGLTAACLGVWLIIPAVPTLPDRSDRHPVGTHIFRWTDASRPELATADPSDRRSVIAQAWYPALRYSRQPKAPRLPYIDGTGRMPPSVSVLPGFLLHRYGQIDTHADASAPLARAQRPWPVVIFSPGYGAPRAFYTGLASELASRGFVVLVVDHPYESGVTELPDGRVVGARENFLPGDPDRTRYMAGLQAVRVADVRFVIDQLARPEMHSLRLPGGDIDASKVAVVGHSFGGATAAAALGEDPRVAAAVNIDGTPYGDLPSRILTRPFMVLQSDRAETPHGKPFVEGNGRLLAGLKAPGFQYEIKQANHYSFTDAPLLFGPVGRWLLSRVIGGERGPLETQGVTADILEAFLSGPLRGTPADIPATVARYPDVVGGPTGPAPQSNKVG